MFDTLFLILSRNLIERKKKKRKRPRKSTQKNQKYPLITHHRRRKAAVHRPRHPAAIHGLLFRAGDLFFADDPFFLKPL